MNYVQYNYYIIECLTRRKKQNIPHCHFTKIDLNEKITLFAKLLPGKFFDQVGQDLSFRKYCLCFCLKLKRFSKIFNSNAELIQNWYVNIYLQKKNTGPICFAKFNLYNYS